MKRRGIMERWMPALNVISTGIVLDQNRREFTAAATPAIPVSQMGRQSVQDVKMNFRAKIRLIGTAVPALNV